MKIHLNDFNLVIEVNSSGSGNLIGTLKQACEYCSNVDCDGTCTGYTLDNEEAQYRLLFNEMMDGIESLILAHACAGIDISSEAYQQGIRVAIESCANQTT